MHPGINIFKNKNDFFGSIASQLIHIANDAFDSSSVFNILLSGGKTPNALYDYIIEKYINKFKWEKTHFFWGDERCVPADYEESNFGQASKHLFKKAQISLANIHPIVGDNHPFLEADRYSTLIHKHFNVVNEIPEFDAVILGIGEDGHIASLFPDQIEFFNSNRLFEVTTHPETGQQRITVTGKIINNSSNIIFMVSGKNKAEIVRKIILKEEGYEKYPASMVIPVLGNVHWYLDDKAASLL